MFYLIQAAQLLLKLIQAAQLLLKLIQAAQLHLRKHLPYKTDHAAILCSLVWAPLVSCKSCVFPSHEMSSHFR